MFLNDSMLEFLHSPAAISKEKGILKLDSILYDEMHSSSPKLNEHTHHIPLTPVEREWLGISKRRTTS